MYHSKLSLSLSPSLYIYVYIYIKQINDASRVSLMVGASLLKADSYSGYLFF